MKNTSWALIATMIFNVLSRSSAASPSLTAPDQSAVAQAVAEFSKQPNLGSYLESLKGEIKEDLRIYLLRKAYETKDLPTPKLSRSSNGELAIEVGEANAVIRMKAKSLEDGKFVINGEDVTILPEDSPEAIWSKVVKALPSRMSSNELSFDLFQNAYALPVGVFVASMAAFAIMTIGLAAAIISIRECSRIRMAAIQCSLAKTQAHLIKPADVTASALSSIGKSLSLAQEARDRLMAKVAYKCEDGRKDLSNCINEIKSIARTFPGFKDPSAPSSSGGGGGNQSRGAH